MSEKTNDDLIDRMIFDSAASMMKSKFPRILGYFFEDTEGYVTNISAGIQAENAQAVILAAHTIKSSSRQLGIATLALRAAETEALAKDVMAGTASWMQLTESSLRLEEIYQASISALKMISLEDKS